MAKPPLRAGLPWTFIAILAGGPAFAQTAPQPAPLSPAIQPVTPRFDILRYEVEGNTLFKQDEIEKIVSPYTGKQRDFGDVQLALEALEQAYRKAGYSAVQVYVPEQEIERGVVTLKVIEARIGKVVIEGNRHFDEVNIRAGLPAVREGAIPNANDISQNVRVANENPAKQLNVILRVGAKEGEVNAGVEVADEPPRKIFLTLDNTGTPQTGMYRAGIGYQNANVGNRDQALTMQYITSPEKSDQVSIYSLGYRIPLYSRGDTIDFIAGISDVDAGTAAIPGGTLQFSGKGKVYGVRYNHFLPRQGAYEQRFSYGLDWRIFENACTLQVGATTTACPSVADVTIHPVSVTYSGNWNLPNGQTGFYGGLSANIPGGSRGNNSDFDLARPGANANYTIWRAGGTYAIAFTNNWQFRAVINGQYTTNQLVPGEQFGMGGATSMRGFLEREIADDKGYSGSLEIYTPDFASRVGVPGSNARALIFYDFGYVSRNDPQPGEIANLSVASMGFGLRFNVKKDYFLRFDFAHVLDGGRGRAKGDERAHIGMIWSF